MRRKNWCVYVQIILDRKSEQAAKIGARLIKLSQNSLALTFMECQSFQMYLTSGDNTVNMW